MLICGDGVGAAKTEKAAKLEVAVVPQEDIWRLLIDAGIA
jgi:hypothetical protein